MRNQPRIVLPSLTLILAIGAVVADRVPAVEPIELAPGPHLLIDDYLIEETSNLTRATHQPEKLPDPLFAQEGWHNWSLFFMDVKKDPTSDGLRMWYNVMTGGDPYRCYCYAESDDGIHWTRPNLGLVPFGGSEKNNVCAAPDAWGLFLVDEGSDCSNPSQRYKMAYFDGGLAVAFSADGLRFEPYGGNPVIEDDEGDVELYEPGYVNLVGDIVDGCWDPLKREYLVICKQNRGGYPGKPNHHVEGWRRTVGMTTSKDFVHWERPWLIVEPDLDNGIEEFYGMQPIVRGNLYIGFLRLLRDDLPADEGGPVRGIGWTELATSRDGENWIRYQEAFLDRHPKSGTFDHAMAWLGDCITVGDKDLIYYCGYLTGHKGGNRQLGMAILRKNGFVSRDAGAEQGTLRTPLVTLQGSAVAVNANVKGRLTVRIVDETGNPLPGFDWDDCMPIEGDSVAHPVAWKGTLEELAGKPVRLEFALTNGQLYGFDVLE